MDTIKAPSAVFVSEAPGKGRGVFASRNIRKGELIEACPVIIIPKKEADLVHATKLNHYVFHWNEKAGTLACVLGYGMLYNHAQAPNAETEIDYANRTLKFFALQSIKRGEEVTHHYYGDPDATERLWFAVKH